MWATGCTAPTQMGAPLCAGRMLVRASRSGTVRLQLLGMCQNHASCVCTRAPLVLCDRSVPRSTWRQRCTLWLGRGRV